MSRPEILMETPVPVLGVKFGQLIGAAIVIMYIIVTLDGLRTGKLGHETVYQDLAKFMGGILAGYGLAKA